MQRVRGLLRPAEPWRGQQLPWAVRSSPAGLLPPQWPWCGQPSSAVPRERSGVGVGGVLLLTC